MPEIPQERRVKENVVKEAGLKKFRDLVLRWVGEYAHSTEEERKDIIESLKPEFLRLGKELLYDGLTVEEIDAVVPSALEAYKGFTIVDPTAPFGEKPKTPAQIRMELGVALSGMIAHLPQPIVENLR